MFKCILEYQLAISEQCAHRPIQIDLCFGANGRKAGYTRMFATGDAVNVDLGLDFGKDEYKEVVRIELRDYYLFTGPQQHVIGLRIGVGKFVAD